MNLVKDDKLVSMLLKVELWFAQFGAIGIGFKIKIDRWPLLGDCER
ncbi:hypothetical protein N184_27280 [Sinorhizobium sp. GL28]|nr:hypothetical protein N184_27280 [Sinorhizobium sp. GL28]